MDADTTAEAVTMKVADTIMRVVITTNTKVVAAADTVTNQMINYT